MTEQRHLTDFVEEQSAAVNELESARSIFERTSKGTSQMAENSLSRRPSMPATYVAELCKALGD
jgi:hypothetical protein